MKRPSTSSALGSPPWVLLPITRVLRIVVIPWLPNPCPVARFSVKAELFVIVQLVRVSVPPIFFIPPNSNSAWQPVTVQLFIESVPPTCTPPPSFAVAEQFETVHPFMVTVAFGLTLMPPPASLIVPLVIVRLLITTVIAGGLEQEPEHGSTSKIRDRPPAFIVVPAGSPFIVTESKMSRSPVAGLSSSKPELCIVKVIVPGGRLIISAPDPAAQSLNVATLLLALMIALRRVQPVPSPLVAESAVLVTVMVLALTSTHDAATVVTNAKHTRSRTNGLKSIPAGRETNLWKKTKLNAAC